MIDPDEQVVLRDFARIANRINVPFVIVGAGARLLVLDWKYELSSTRTTTDWDMGVRVPDWNAFRQLKETLVAGSDPLFNQDNRIEHRVRHHRGTAIDIVPFGGVESEDGTITLPEDDKQMVVLGFREVLANAMNFDLGEGVTAPVATPAGLAVLKVFAFNDRKKDDDLRDLYFILDKYDQAGNEDRIFDELSDLLSDGKVEYEYAGAYLLGIDVGHLASSQTLASFLDIIGRFLDPYSADLALLIPLLGDELHEEAQREHIAKKFSAFRAGIYASAKN
jgi:predicted nucleotidyltransferase